jgi:hypothetical protein
MNTSTTALRGCRENCQEALKIHLAEGPSEYKNRRTGILNEAQWRLFIAVTARRFLRMPAFCVGEYRDFRLEANAGVSKSLARGT